MKPVGNHRWVMAAILGAFVLAMWPMPVGAADDKWIDAITTVVKEHQELAKSEGRQGAYDEYLGQLAIVRMTFETGGREMTAVAMNRLMDMLQNDPKGSGIPTWSAKTIFDFCGKVTPAGYHDAARHRVELSKGGFDYWGDNVYDPGAGG